MTMELKTDVNIPYLDEEDAFDIFVTTVNNGQTRLSLEVLVDILATVLNKVNELDENVTEIIRVLTDEDGEQVPEEIQTQEPEKVVAEEKKEEVQEKTPSPKAKAKKEEVEIKE